MQSKIYLYGSCSLEVLVIFCCSSPSYPMLQRSTLFTSTSLLPGSCILPSKERVWLVQRFALYTRHYSFLFLNILWLITTQNHWGEESLIANQNHCDLTRLWIDFVFCGVIGKWRVLLFIITSFYVSRKVGTFEYW